MARNVVTAVDSADFFVQAKDSLTNILNVVTTATSSVVSADITNTLHKGAIFYVAIASVTVTAATLALNINGKNAVDGLYYPVCRVSVDGVSVGSQGKFTAQIYPGVTTPGPANANAVSAVLPAVFQVQASLTISNTTATMSGTVSYSVGISKIL